MLNFTSKTESKLLQTIPHKGVDLCSSLSTLMWGFVFTITYKLSQTRPRIEATLRDSLRSLHLKFKNKPNPFCSREIWFKTVQVYKELLVRVDLHSPTWKRIVSSF